MTSKQKETKTFADISKDIQKKYKDRYDPISLKGLTSEMERLRDLQEEVKTQMEPKISPEEATQQFFNGGPFDKITIGRNSGYSSFPEFTLPNIKPDFGINANIKPFGTDPTKMNERTYGVSPTDNPEVVPTGTYGRDPLMYASALGPLAALMMNKKTDPIDRGAAGRFVSTGAAGVGDGTGRQTEFKDVSMSPIERALAEQGRGFSGMNAQVSGGNAGQFLSNELANQVNILGQQGQAKLGQQQMNTQIAGMNAQEQARIDQIKMQNQARNMQAEQVNAGLALQYDEIDAMNEGAYRTNQSNAVQGIFQNLGTIGKENTQGNIILKALGYDEMGNYGGKGKSSMELLDWIKKGIFKK